MGTKDWSDLHLTVLSLEGLQEACCRQKITADLERLKQLLASQSAPPPNSSDRPET